MQTLHTDQLQTMTEHPNQVVGLWLPTEKFSLLKVAAPSAPRRKWPALVPWLVEDQVLEPVEKLHFTLVDNKDSLLRVLVTGRKNIDDILEQVKEFNLDVAIMQPDYLALPWDPQQDPSISRIVIAWRLSGKSRVLIVRYSENEGFAASESVAEVLINQLLSEQSGDSPDSSVEIQACMPDEALPEFLAGREVTTRLAPDWDMPMTSSINILHGDYQIKPVKGNTGQWWLTAALLLLAAGLFWTWLKVDANRLEQQLTALEEAQSRQVSQLFPGIRAGDDIRTTLETLQNDRFRQSEKLREPVPGLMQLLDVVLSDCNCSLQKVNINQSGGTLQFSSPPPRISAFNNLYGISATSSQSENGQTEIVLQRSGQ